MADEEKDKGSESGFTTGDAVTVFKGLTSGAAARQQSKALKKAAEKSKQASEFNANILEGNAEEVLETARVNAELNYRNTQAIQNIADFNNRNLIKSANQTEAVAQQLAERKRREGRRLGARQEVLYLNSGVNLSGTALDVMNDSAIENEMDVLTIIYNGMREADTIRSHAENVRYKGEVDVFNSKARTKEILRTAAVDAENLRKEAELNRIKGDVVASSYRSQANAVMLDGITDTVGTFYDLYQSGALGGSKET